jgi:hypothetical protein
MTSTRAAHDLADPSTRDAVIGRLVTRYAGRPVVLGPGVLAAFTDAVARHRARGSRVLVLSTTRGAGPVPDHGACEVVELALAPADSVTDELRQLDALAHDLPEEVVAAIEAFDPDREAVWNPGNFVTTDEPLLGRELLGGRPRAFLALEDKLLADEVWAAAGVPHAPYRIVPARLDDLTAASEELAGQPGTLGTVWSGDARDGFNGAGNYVRWVLDEADRTEAFAFFAPRCDRVRVMPFLDGVPCSIHGIVLPDGTAVFRPVEIASLRDPGRRRFLFGGLSSWWDPPAADREEMRGHARRVGEHLRERHGYRGAFGIDGVLTADGFRPTELNTRVSAGLTQLGKVAGELVQLVHDHLVAGHDTGLGHADLESLLPLMDAQRSGRAVAVGEGGSVGGSDEYAVAWDGRHLTRADEPTGNVLVLGDTASGFFAKIDPCAALGPGDRLGPLNAGLMRHLDATHGSSFGDAEAAPDLR